MNEDTEHTPTGRMPVIYLPHGGGPWPLLQPGFFSAAEAEALTAYLRSLSASLPAAPRALLVVSAHWEEAVPTVMTHPSPPLLFDYYGFPPETYRLTWPAPGTPTLAARVRGLLEQAGFETAADASRGFDHGTFVPLMVAWPDAEVPAIQLSLQAELDPAQHLAMGRALAPLRDEGVLIIGSGMSYHNMRGFGGRGAADAAAFDSWLRDVATVADPQLRAERLAAWASAPAGRASHPREEHLLPLLVIAGAAGPEPGRTAFSGTFSGVCISAFHYG